MDFIIRVRMPPNSCCKTVYDFDGVASVMPEPKKTIGLGGLGGFGSGFGVGPSYIFAFFKIKFKK